VNAKELQENADSEAAPFCCAATPCRNTTFMKESSKENLSCILTERCIITSKPDEFWKQFLSTGEVEIEHFGHNEHSYLLEGGK